VSVEAAATAPLQRRQQELFSDGTQRRDPRHLAVLLERLSSRLGRRAVLGVRLMSDAAPQRAWRHDPLIGACRPRRRRPKPPAELPPRPLRLLPRPAPLDAMSVVPDGPPLRFHLYGREHQVARTWGPERIETGWWRGCVVGRDYYRIETTTGRRFWLFRRLRDGQWFVHGMFE
jgi:protein ImuB